jgi:hypothetical protein
VSDTLRDRIAAALREEDYHSCMYQEGIDADALADTVLRVLAPELATVTCDASIAEAGFFGNQTLGPCVLRAGHDGPMHQAANGAKWGPRLDGIVRIPEPMTEEQVDAIRTAWNEHYGHAAAAGFPSPFSVIETVVPPALRGPNCPRPPNDPEPLRKLAEQAILDQQTIASPEPIVLNGLYEEVMRLVSGPLPWAPQPALCPCGAQRINGQVVHVEGCPDVRIWGPAGEQCRAEFHHPTMQSARCDLPAGHAEAMHREQRDPTRAAFRWDNSVATYPTDTTEDRPRPAASWSTASCPSRPSTRTGATRRPKRSADRPAPSTSSWEFWATPTSSNTGPASPARGSPTEAAGSCGPSTRWAAWTPSKTAST